MNNRYTIILVGFAFVLSAIAFVLRLSGIDHETDTLMTILPGIAAFAFGFMLWNYWKARRG